jgi:hypothetical protein
VKLKGAAWFVETGRSRSNKFSGTELIKREAAGRTD